MAVVLTYAASVPVVKVGRIAGQYAKPRSLRHRDPRRRHAAGVPRRRGQRLRLHPRGPAPRPAAAGRGLPRLRGDAEPRARVRHRRLRRPAPGARLEPRLRPRRRRSGQRYEKLAAEIDRALTFMKAIGADPDEFHRVDFYSSHEALLLEYEHALTRIDSRTEQPYDVSGPLRLDRRAHPPARRRARRAARHIRNPIGVKLGPTTTPDDALALAAQAQPATTSRAGSPSSPGWARARSATGCPTLVEKVTAAGRQVAWVCDPMHGNTFEASVGLQDPPLRRRDRRGPGLLRGAPRARHLARRHPRRAHRRRRHRVRRRRRGARRGRPAHRYETACDPRLNRIQSLELAFLVAEMLRRPDRATQR